MGNHGKAWRGARRREGERTLRTQGAGGVEAIGNTGPFELATAVGKKTPGEGQRRSRRTRVKALGAGVDSGHTLKESENPGVDVLYLGNGVGRGMRGKPPRTRPARAEVEGGAVNLIRRYFAC